jgi:hypothetical protein
MKHTMNFTTEYHPKKVRATLATWRRPRSLQGPQRRTLAVPRGTLLLTPRTVARVCVCVCVCVHGWVRGNSFTTKVFQNKYMDILYII